MAQRVVNFSIKGGRQLQEALKALGDPKAATRAGRAALRKAAAPMVETAKSLVPEDQGDLKRSIKQGAGRRVRVGRGGSREGIDDAGDQVFQIIAIDQNVQPPVDVSRADGSGTYRDPGVAGVGPMIEFGTDEMPAQPFMRPAFEAHKVAAAAAITSELKTTIEQQAKRLAKKRARAAS